MEIVFPDSLLAVLPLILQGDNILPGLTFNEYKKNYIINVSSTIGFSNITSVLELRCTVPNDCSRFKA